MIVSEAPKGLAPREASSNPMIAVKDLHKWYPRRGGGTVKAVDSVSFAVERNEIVGLLGPNGAGKTTTIKGSCGLIVASKGEILLNGADATGKPHQAGRHVAALLEGNRNIYWRLTVRENLEFFAALQAQPRAQVNRLIGDLIGRLALGPKRDTIAGQLSKGMQQKLAVACALVRQTPVVLLDEPTLGLDVTASRELQTIISELPALGRTVVVSSHDMHFIQQVCKRVVIISGGKVVVDDDIRNLLDLFQRRYYSVKLQRRLTSDEVGAVRAVFPHTSVTDGEGGRTFEVDLEPEDNLYDLMRILERHNHVIESMTQSAPNLEEVFLRVVGGPQG